MQEPIRKHLETATCFVLNKKSLKSQQKHERSVIIIAPL